MIEREEIIISKKASITTIATPGSESKMINIEFVEMETNFNTIFCVNEEEAKKFDVGDKIKVKIIMK